MLTPSKRLWVCPLIVSGDCTPRASRTVGTRSIAWWYCSRISPLAFMPAGHEMTQGSDVPPFELVALPHLERRVERHRPAVGVVVVGLRPAEVVEHGEVGSHVVRDSVHELH